MKTAPTIEKRAVEIAAVIMVRAGLCRYSSYDKCRRLGGLVSERDCALCIKRWLIGKAKKELAREKEDKPT